MSSPACVTGPCLCQLVLISRRESAYQGLIPKPQEGKNLQAVCFCFQKPQVLFSKSKINSSLGCLCACAVRVDVCRSARGRLLLQTIDLGREKGDEMGVLKEGNVLWGDQRLL